MYHEEIRARSSRSTNPILLIKREKEKKNRSAGTSEHFHREAILQQVTNLNIISRDSTEESFADGSQLDPLRSSAEDLNKYLSSELTFRRVLLEFISSHKNVDMCEKVRKSWRRTGEVRAQLFTFRR